MPDLQLPDGRIIKDIPEGITKDQITSKLVSSGILTGKEDWLNTKQEAQPTDQESSLLENIGKGAYQGLNQLGTGIYQTAADLGVHFEGAKKLLSIVRPDLADEFSKMTPEDISQILADKTKQENTQDANKPLSYKIAKVASGTAPFLAVGGESLIPSAIAAGTAQSALSAQEEPGLANRGKEAAIGGAISGLTAGVLKGGGELAKKGFGLIAPTISKQAIKDFAEAGIKPTLADVSDSNGVKLLQSGLAKVPLAGSPITVAKNEALDSIKNQLLKIEPSVPATQEQAGQILQKGAGNYVQRFKNVSQQLYDRVDRYIKPNEQVPISNLSNLADQEINRFSSTPALQERLDKSEAGRIISDIAADANAGNGQLPYNVLKRYRTIVGQSLGDTFTIGGPDRALLKNVYGALSDDMKSAVATKGKQAATAFENANTFYNKGISDIENNLSKTINSNVPEQVFNQAFTGTKEGGTKIRSIFKTLSPDEQGTVRSSFINKIGVNDKTGDFVPQQFIAKYNQVSPEAKAVIFTPEQRGALDNLNRVTQRIAKGNKLENYSNTASHIATGAEIYGIASHPLITTGLVGGGYIGAKLMTNPTFINLIAKAEENLAKGSTTMPKVIKGLSLMASQNPDYRNDIRHYIQSLDANASGMSKEEASRQLALNDYQGANRTTHYEPSEQEIKQLADQKLQQSSRDRYKQASNITHYMPDQQELRRITQ